MEMKFVGWNAYCTRFVAAPKLEWEPFCEVDRYRVRLADPAEVIVDDVVREPRWDLAAVWDRVPCGNIDLLVQALDGAGGLVAPSLHRRFYKGPAWDGVAQEPMDWRAAVARNIAYLLEPAQDKVEPYEEGLPRFCWSSVEDSGSRQRLHYTFPALHHPSYVFAFLNYAEQFPSAANAEEARRQAREYGDWLLKYRHPAEYACSLFPFSTIVEGAYEGGCEGNSITLFRAARAGEAMLYLHRAFGEQKYLDYALHLGRVFARLQNPDGSWPYRIDPRTGEVKEEYTSNAMSPARFLEDLGRALGLGEFDGAAAKATAWMLENPVKTSLWQGQYEDVTIAPPYANLENWDVNETIRYLTAHAGEDAGYVEIARRLNAYIEDQFVLWGEEDDFVKCPTPTALEQYRCYHPMECHTGHWLLSLIALHQQTKDETYLHRAIAAANSILKGQHPSGAFSTWGRDRRFGDPLNSWDWPGCNAVAGSALMILQKYCDCLGSGAVCALAAHKL